MRIVAQKKKNSKLLCVHVFGGLIMKKNAILIVLLIFSVMCLFTSCKSMDTYEENLGSQYEIKRLNRDELLDIISGYISGQGQVMLAYDIKEALFAVNENSGDYVLIFELSEVEEAKAFYEALASAFSSFAADDLDGADLVRDSNFVLLGTTGALDTIYNV